MYCMYPVCAAGCIRHGARSDAEGAVGGQSQSQVTASGDTSADIFSGARPDPNTTLVLSKPILMGGGHLQRCTSQGTGPAVEEISLGPAQRQQRVKRLTRWK